MSSIRKSCVASRCWSAPDGALPLSLLMVVLLLVRGRGSGAVDGVGAALRRHIEEGERRLVLDDVRRARCRRHGEPAAQRVLLFLPHVGGRQVVDPDFLGGAL